MVNENLLSLFNYFKKCKPMKKSVLTLITVLSVVLFFASCGDSKYPGFKKTDNGLYYKIHFKSDDTTMARSGDVLSLVMEYYVEKNGKDSMFSESPKGQPFDVPMMESTYKGDIFEGLALLHKGDSATFILSADSFFLRTVGVPYLPPYIDSGSVIKVNVKVTDIKNQKQIEALRDKEAKEAQLVESDNIKKYISENGISQTPDENGVYFIEKTAGNGKKVETNKYAIIHFIGDIIGGENFGNTYNTKEPVNYLVGTGRLGVGFETYIQKMKKGGKATLIIPSSQAFGPEGNGYMIPPFSPLKLEVEVLDVLTEKELTAKRDAEAKAKQASEMTDLKKFVQKNYPKAKQTASGMFYSEVAAGTGKTPGKGDMVKVHYKGTLLDGTKFDASYDRNEPFKFTIGNGEVIPGWDEGLSLMKVGGKAVLIIPSKLGYGAQGSGPIPAFSSLVFEVELLDASASPLK